MIGKAEWFTRRKYGGWGLCPKDWRGWAYTAAFIIPFAIFQSLPFWSNNVRAIVTVIWLAVLLIDVFSIMVKVKKDEREKIHEAIAERNALWVMVPIIAFGVAFQAAQSAVLKRVELDWFLVIALFAGLIAKAVTNIYLDRKD